MLPLITGSIAFDYIMRVNGRFTERLPTPLHPGFSAAYATPSLRRAFGGCAGNIAYGLRQLGDSPTIMGTVGDDFSPYRKYLRSLDIDDTYVKTIPDIFTAQAYIINDDDNSQLILFHAGAANEAHQQSIVDLPTPPPLAIVSPNGREGMLRFGRELAAAQTPFIFDPGQAIDLFSGEELITLMEQCTWAIVNADEFAALEKTTGISRTRATEMVQALIITYGENGSEVFASDTHYHADAARLGETQDTTGCGDAYRAGVIHGLLRDWEWPRIIRFAAVVAGAKAVHNGGQGYCITAAEATTHSEKIFS
ncbi:carbohydrate kinase family protein [Candidatus Persebacteraceae bacterium Df01]|jgi:adenosine kinase|uniref:Carbohydrate kinase family protein n=1 Tax=Candidatus Doriopsillibacter californiensis TaxID=2970740 RepID=A0ABT7QL56_9GAMM|nr:carbohydrate kinase family protein [Candidatus Persebacteraceae bacterium Df01]